MSYEQSIQFISSLLLSHEFKVVASSVNYTKYQSKSVILIISLDPRDNMYSVFVGKKEGSINELFGKRYEAIFGLDFSKLEGSFAEKFTRFLNTNGSPIITGDLKKLTELERYCWQENINYTNNILNNQTFNAANKAWEEEKFKEFVDHLGLMPETFLPDSYKLKRKIALRKMEEGK